MERLKKNPSRRAWTTASSTTRRCSCANRFNAVGAHARRGPDPAGRLGRGHLPANLARVHHPAARRAGFAGRHVRHHAGAGFLAQHPFALRPGAGHRHRRGRCDRRRRERGTEYRAGFEPHEAAQRAMEEVSGPIIAIALVLCAVFMPTALSAASPAVLQAVRSHDRHLDRHLGVQLADLSARPLRGFAESPSTHRKIGFTRVMEISSSAGFSTVQPLVGALPAGMENSATGVARCRARRRGLARLLGSGRAHRLEFQQVSRRVRADAGQSIWSPSPNCRTARAGTHRSCHPAHDRHRPEAPGVKHAIAFPGLSINGFTSAPNAGIVFFTLKPFEERKVPGLQRHAIADAIEPAVRAPSRKPLCSCSRRRPSRDWAPLAVSNSTSKIAPIWASTPSIQASRAHRQSQQTPGLQESSPPSPSTCRNSTPTSTA